MPSSSSAYGPPSCTRSGPIRSRRTRFDVPVVLNYNIAFCSPPATFRLPPGDHERFSLALAYGRISAKLKTVVRTVQADLQCELQLPSLPPSRQRLLKPADHYVRVMWTDVSERGDRPGDTPRTTSKATGCTARQIPNSVIPG